MGEQPFCTSCCLHSPSRCCSVLVYQTLYLPPTQKILIANILGLALFYSIFPNKRRLSSAGDFAGFKQVFVIDLS